VYDVTDDWRSAGQPPRIVRRIVRAEDKLAHRAATIVCSDVLKQRWRSRYEVDAPIVRNGIDLDAWQSVTPITQSGPGPHVGYVGTLHEQRLDVDLIIDLTRRPEIGTVHLVGPDCLDAALSRHLRHLPGLRLHGAVAARQVPGWMTAMDVLISPHLVNDFTLSLDAIKSHEYAASGRPVVATPTSGFTDGERASVVPAASFADEVVRAPHHPSPDPLGGVCQAGASWADRAGEFWSAIGTTSKESLGA
jgi:glycosyltransferase involved in cell wall biosynthesis